MSTMPVKDADGASVTIPVPTVGQATMANSSPVAIASDQSAIPVTGPLTDAALRATAVPVSGTVAVSGAVAVTGTFYQTTQPVSIASTLPISAVTLPLPSGAATAAKQPALGTAGTASADVLTVQGATSMTALKVDGSATTQPVSGTVAVSAANIDASLKSGTATRASVPSAATSTTILASNTNRKGAIILNSDANALLLDLSGGTAASTRYQVRLVQYANYEVGSGYTGLITGIWEADGAGAADVVEFT